MKSGYYIELLTPETMKLHGSTEENITKDKNGEMCHIWKILRGYQFIVISSIINTNVTHWYYLLSLKMNHLVIY